MPDPIGPSVSYVPATTAVLVVGDRPIPLEEWPMARSVAERHAMETRQEGADLLAIEPKRRSVIGVIVLSILMFLGGSLPTVVATSLDLPGWLSIVMGLVTLAGLLFLVRLQLSGLRSIRFDRAAGRLVIDRRVGFRRRTRTEASYPLETVLAVQLLFNGLHSVSETLGQGDQQSTSYRQFFGYELNLVLDDPNQRRLNLFSIADWAWIRRTGQTLGAFLQVPVIDKLHHG